MNAEPIIIKSFPDYMGLLSDEDKKLYEDKNYYAQEPLALALIRALESLNKNFEKFNQESE